MKTYTGCQRHSFKQFSKFVFSAHDECQAIDHMLTIARARRIMGGDIDVAAFDFACNDGKQYTAIAYLGDGLTLLDHFQRTVTQFAGTAATFAPQSVRMMSECLEEYFETRPNFRLQA